MTTASGSRVVPQSRKEVWRALAVLEPYCPVCDVSYVLDGPAAGKGATFVCVPGRLDGEQPPDIAPRGEIVEWETHRRVTTRLVLTPETWTTRIELEKVTEGPDAGGTRVTVTITQQPRGGSRVARWLQAGAMQRLVQRTVDGELEKLPAHLAQVAAE